MQNLDLAYDAMGNITTKSDVGAGAWTYHATKKHAVTNAAGNVFTYDGNGNQITRNGQSITWTSYNYPSHVPNGSRYHDYFYDAHRQRWKQVYYDGAATETTVFVGGLLEKHTAGSITEYRHMISVGDQPVALYTRPSSGAITTRYFLLDHLGSVAEITNGSGGLDVAESFAAFGERRDPSDWSGPPSSAELTTIGGITQRGYTFHTNLESSSLIHMNGRIMDGLTGRFLSPDPHLMDPQLTQAFNRYSYVYNNPLTYTDPSGFCVDGCISVVGSVVATVVGFGKKLFGKKKRPPPKGCLGLVATQACYGKSTLSKLFEMANDILKTPGQRMMERWEEMVYGMNGTFGSGPCGPICMSLDEIGYELEPKFFRDNIFGQIISQGPIGVVITEISQVLGGPEDYNPLSGVFDDRPLLDRMFGFFDLVGGAETAFGKIASGTLLATVRRGTAAVAGHGFRSHSALTRALGPAGPGQHWHHVVEQTPGNVARFGAQSVQNTQNVMRLDAGVHRQISGFYSSIQPFTSGQTVRQWLSTQSFEQQAQFGLDTLRRFGVGP